MQKKEYLEELIRKITAIISPNLYDDSVNTFSDKEKKNKLFKNNPKCFVSVQCGNRKPILLPVCNSQGMEDFKIIRFSINLMEKLRKKFDDEDQEQIDQIIKKLKRLENKFTADVPKPTNMAVLKAKSTINLNRIKSDIERIRNY